MWTGQVEELGQQQAGRAGRQELLTFLRRLLRRRRGGIELAVVPIPLGEGVPPIVLAGGADVLDQLIRELPGQRLHEVHVADLAPFLLVGVRYRHVDRLAVDRVLVDQALVDQAEADCQRQGRALDPEIDLVVLGAESIELELESPELPICVGSVAGCL